MTTPNIDPGPNHRLLTEGELLMETDEFLCRETHQWTLVSKSQAARMFVGEAWTSRLTKVRRRLNPAQAAENQPCDEFVGDREVTRFADAFMANAENQPVAGGVDYCAPTPETAAFMARIDDSEFDQLQVEAALSDMENERNAARADLARLEAANSALSEALTQCLGALRREYESQGCPPGLSGDYRWDAMVAVRRALAQHGPKTEERE